MSMEEGSEDSDQERYALQRQLQLSLDDGLEVERFKRRFKLSTNVRDVSLKVSHSNNETTSERTRGLLRGLQYLKKLKTITFEPRNESYACSLPVQTLSAAVTHSRNLKDVFVSNLVIRGSTQDLDMLARVIRRRQSLEEFALVGCRFPDPTRSPALDSLVRSMVDIAQIQVVQIQATALNQLGTLTSPAVTALCHSKTIMELKLRNFDLTDDQFMTAVRSLETNKTLRELSLGHCNFTIVTTAALAKMLRRNSSLTNLELTPKGKIEDKLLIQIAEVLDENTSLKQFELRGDYGPLSQPVKDAFERMLEDNYMMRSLKVYSGSESVQEFRMYLRLNRIGRHNLLDPKGKVSRLDWVNAIHQVNDSLDCIFYFLSVNPFLCHLKKEVHSQALIARRGAKRRRLNDSNDKVTSENSSSVNSSLSSSENSWSPEQSEERQASTDTDNRASAPSSSEQPVTSKSESSNANTREEPGSDVPGQRLHEPSPSTGSGSNEESNQVVPAPASQAPQDQQNQVQGFLAAIFNGLMGGQQAQTVPPIVGLPAGSIELLATGLQALIASQQGPQQQQQQQQTPPQQQQQNQMTSDQPQFSQTQIAQTLASAMQQLQQQAPQQLQQMNIQHPQQQQQQQAQVVQAANPTNSMFNMAFPLLLQSMIQTGQMPQTQQQTLEQQMQQAFSAAIIYPPPAAQSAQQAQASSQYMQGPQEAVGHSQEPSMPAARAILPEAEITSSDRNSYPLYMPRDKDCLSSYQCFLRQQIELFEASAEDVKSTMPGRNKPIRLGQVGLRCRHCAMLPSRYRGTGATYYPAKLDRLYQAAQNMAQTHFTKHCRHIPQEIVHELGVLLQGSKSSAGAGKKYWSDGATMLGVYEDDDILRMDRSRATA